MKKQLSIREAAEYLGVSLQTLRRWDNDGSFPASFVSPGGHRYYLLSDLEKRIKGLFQTAKEWACSKTSAAPAEAFYCATNDIFRARLEHLSQDLERSPTLQALGPLVTSIVGEIGNNSFDHNLGNWPDVLGIFFAYDLSKRLVVLADRGRGILTTLRKVRPQLKDDAEALQIAFTEILTGRAPEHRGNGLKYVKNAVLQSHFHLRVQTGSAELELNKGDTTFHISPCEPAISGCLALLEF